uniref:Homeobox domain-containing protein n=1 Tax=Meloidogyne incognita TaxID=6306 RepID=A0A914LAH3_MELIC
MPINDSQQNIQQQPETPYQQNTLQRHFFIFFLNLFPKHKHFLFLYKFIFFLFRHSLDVSSLTDDQLENYYLIYSLQQFLKKSLAKSVLLRVKAVLLFHQGRYEEFKEYIKLNKFKQKDHNLLQNLWNEANYAEASKQRTKPLDAVSRYRIRKKNIFPSSIWDGEGTSYCFKKKAREILKQAYKIDSIPNIQTKQELAKQTELSVLQVSNWFKNQRQRARQNIRESKQLKNKKISEECNCCNTSSSDYAESEGRQSVNQKG